MERTVDIHKAAAIIIRDRRLLITRSKGKNFFISPGGRVEEGETAVQALVRELREEVSIEVAPEHLTPFGTFYADAIGLKNQYLQMDVFTVRVWEGEIVPSSEVEEVQWVNSVLPDGLELGSIFKHDILPKLKSLDLID